MTSTQTALGRLDFARPTLVRARLVVGEVTGARAGRSERKVERRKPGQQAHDGLVHPANGRHRGEIGAPRGSAREKQAFCHPGWQTTHGPEVHEQGTIGGRLRMS